MNRPGPSRLKPSVSRFTNEILSMMGLFGCPDTADLEPTAKAMESYIRIALSALIARAKAVSQRRGSTSKPIPEDFLFCLRETPGLVARLADYLSWKEIRRKSNHEHQEEVPTVGGIEESEIASIAGGSSLDMFKQQQLKVALSWDFSYTLADALSYFDDARDNFLGDAEWTERLKAMDELTQGMSPEEYKAFANSRKASFSYGKSKRFREFIGYHNLLDTQPSDEIVDILSFLAYELVGYYTRISKAARDQELSIQPKSSAATAARSPAPTASRGQPRSRSPAPPRRLEPPTGPFSMPVERLPNKNRKGGGREKHPITSEHLTSAIKSQGLGLNLITPKAGGFGFGNFGGPGKKRRLV